MGGTMTAADKKAEARAALELLLQYPLANREVIDAFAAACAEEALQPDPRVVTYSKTMWTAARNGEMAIGLAGEGVLAHSREDAHMLAHAVDHVYRVDIRVTRESR